MRNRSTQTEAQGTDQLGLVFAGGLGGVLLASLALAAGLGWAAAALLYGLAGATLLATLAFGPALPRGARPVAIPLRRA